MGEIKLKPCPFCGGEAEFITGVKYASVRCKNDDCQAAFGFSPDAARAAEAWNRRTDGYARGSKIRVPKELEPIKKRLQAATPGPWLVYTPTLPGAGRFWIEAENGPKKHGRDS